VERLHVAGQPAQLPGERPDQRAAEPGLRVEQPLEVRSAEDQRLGRLQRDHGRRVRLAVEQRELAEEVSGAQRGEDRGLGRVGRGQDDLHRAGGDDVQRVPGIALVEHRLVPPVAARPQAGETGVHGVDVDPLEQHAAGQRLSRK
jgi:hypothetical protein